MQSENENIDNLSAKVDEQTDVIIAGAGATGLALGLAITRFTDLQVAIVEAGAEINEQSNAEIPSDFLDLRSVALSAQSCQFLSEIGLPSVQQLGCPIDHIHVSDKGHLAQSTMHASDYNLPELGRVVELPLLVSKLYQALKPAQKKLSWFWQNQIVAIDRASDSVSVKLSSGTHLNARLLVVAEGGNSPTREKLGIDVTQYNYHQSAIVANIELAEDHKNWAFERFTSNGPLALLPLPDNDSEQNRHRCSLVWTVAEHQRESMMALDEADFLDHFQAEFGYRLGKFKSVGERAWFPLVLTKANLHIHHRAALLGNACQTLHPIAGQGLNLALRDVKTLMDLLNKNTNTDPGDFVLLNAYQRVRKQDQSALIAATETLVSTFSNDYFPLVIGRNLALMALDNLPAAKRSLAFRAMGFYQNKGAEDAAL